MLAILSIIVYSSNTNQLKYSRNLKGATNSYEYTTRI